MLHTAHCLGTGDGGRLEPRAQAAQQPDEWKEGGGGREREQSGSGNEGASVGRESQGVGAG
eukprot:scaffold925_cov133-Isochrysis_galbana.AAC.1